KGASWSCGTTQLGNKQADAPTALYWFPIGTAASGLTFERVSDAVAPSFISSGEIAEPQPRLQDKYADEFVELIEVLTGRPVSPETKPRLLALLRGMGAHV